MDFYFLMDMFLHTPQYLDHLFSEYSLLAYFILFMVLFLETGIVITPFLPGDSILFGVGAIAAVTKEVNIPITVLLLISAVILGDSVNYRIGQAMRAALQKKKKLPLIRYEHIVRTQDFFTRHGGKTITLARFVPIIRTFAPFVAGASNMEHRKFLGYNILGGVSWVSLMFGIGYLFGNITLVKDHFSLVTLGIIFLSLIPVVVTWLQNRERKKTTETEEWVWMNTD